ncbi:nuclear transcription factor Y subunit C-1-like isoform X1 [Solanum dulcamara]|uniref:nuclear transcription factor Y subunit C-1-like isoform X1 n=1 Tax=Solanum dulcamara TaxID=45834 RepID=UPI0024854172|nr:nuclear transcription factor Y subunit C-1-like isoform X1 [Solanum dulcamara]
MENNSDEQSAENAGQLSASQHLLEKQKEQLEMFWAYQLREMEKVNDFKNHQLPPTRIKKIMKSDQDVHMVSTESPILLAKACEFFILELTLRSWLHAQRRTLQKNDLTAAITQNDIFDFLLDVVPGDNNAITDHGSLQSFLPFYASEGSNNGQDNNLDHQSVVDPDLPSGTTTSSY